MIKVAPGYDPNNTLVFTSGGQLVTDRFGMSSARAVWWYYGDSPESQVSIFSAHPRWSFLEMDKRTIVLRPDGAWDIVGDYFGVDGNPEPIYALDNSTSQEPIETHPNFAAFGGNGAVFDEDGLFVGFKPVVSGGVITNSKWVGTAFAFCRLRCRLPRLRRRDFTLVDGEPFTFREKKRFHAPRSLWLHTLAAYRRVNPREPEVTPTEVPPLPPVPTVVLTAWDALARSFAEHVADAHARISATWGNVRHRATLAQAALAAVQTWVRAGAKRLPPAADLPAALLRRAERAKAAGVQAFTYWPASLLRAVRRELDLVAAVRVEVAQTVRVSA